MKYRTIIEIICEASNREEAANIAGEYLKGELDFGVTMKCRSERLTAHNAVKAGIVTALCLLVFGSALLNVSMVGDNGEKVKSSFSRGLYNTYTVMPALKTKHKADFKKEWESKRSEAILEYLKK